MPRRIFIFFIIFMAGFFLVLDARTADADAWWGKGYRSSAWVVAHGGTIIRYKIINGSGDSNDYKAELFDANGKNIEKELGDEGIMDDAKNGTYTVKVYKGDFSKGTFKDKRGKKFAEVTVRAHPGETIWIDFNYKTKQASVRTNYKAIAVKPKTEEATAPENKEGEPGETEQKIEQEIEQKSEQEMAIQSESDVQDAQPENQENQSNDNTQNVIAAVSDNNSERIRQNILKLVGVSRWMLSFIVI